MYTSYTSKAQKNIPIAQDSAALCHSQTKKTKKSPTVSNVHKKNPHTVVKSRSNLLSSRTLPNSKQDNSPQEQSDNNDTQQNKIQEESYCSTKQGAPSGHMSQYSDAAYSTNAVATNDIQLSQLTSDPSSGSVCVGATYNSTQDTVLLPGFTSMHASMHPTYEDPSTPTASTSIIIEGMPPHAPKKKSIELDFTTGWLSKKIPVASKKSTKKQSTKKTKQGAKRVAKTQKTSKHIRVGMTVSGKFGELPPKTIDGSVKRRTRQKKLAKVIGCSGKGLWEILYLDGSKDIKSTNVLTIETSVKFDEIFEEHTKIQSVLTSFCPLDTEPNVDTELQEPHDDEPTTNTTNTQRNTNSPHESTTNMNLDGVCDDLEPSMDNIDTRNEGHLSDDDSWSSMPGMIRRSVEDGYDSDDSDDSGDESSVDSYNLHRNNMDEYDRVDAERTEQHSKNMTDARNRMDTLIGKTITVDGHTKKNKKIEWTIVKEHVANENITLGRRTYSLGIRNKQTLSAIKRSNVPLAELFLFLNFKDGNWWTKLGKMNSNICNCNEKNEFNPNYRKLTMFSPTEFLKCYALFIGAAVHTDRGVNLWKQCSKNETSNPNWDNIAHHPDFAQYGIDLPRFKTWKRFVPTIWEDLTLRGQNDPWWRFASAINDFNKIRKEGILTSSDRVLDESMCAYRPRTTKLGGLPNISFIKRKPEPLGTEFKSTVCPTTKIMTYLEIQRGKSGMEHMPYYKDLGATAACTVRLAEGVGQSYIDDKVECVLGDSWFGSVRSVCAIAGNKDPTVRESMFQVKGNSRGFPKKQLQLILGDEPGGTSVVLKATDPDTGTKLVAVGYKYNTKTVLLFVASEGAGSTCAGTPYEMKFPDRYGNVKVRYVPRPDMVTKYFDKSNVVDVHNQLRQFSLKLEKKWVTSNAYFRLHTSLTGINVVDCFRLAHFHSIFKQNSVKCMSIQDKLDDMEGFGNVGSQEGNIVTLRTFAGVLCVQLLKYAENQYTKISRPMITVDSDRSRDDCRVIESLSSDESLYQEAAREVKKEQKEQLGMVEVFDEIFDVNGQKHHCVKNPFNHQSNGKGFTSSRKCRRSGCMHKTRAKCLECGISLCFPIRDTSGLSKIENCFITHVHQIPRKYNSSKMGYVDVSGRKG